MSGLVNFFTRTPVIIASGILTVLVGLSFNPVQQAIDGPMLDMLTTGEAARARIAELDMEQRFVHFLGTVINDTLFPLAYGAFFAGLAGRFSAAKWRGWFMLPAALAGIIDLMENTVQALALYGSENLLFLKDVLTPAKLGFFFLSMALAFGLSALALGRWLVRKMRTA